MNSAEVAVIDYGMGNLLSVRRGLEYCGATVVMTADPAVILSASRVLLPGVGAFADGMKELRRQGLDAVVREVAARGNKLLGICLGMQMLLDESEEFGVTGGLGLIPGRVIPIPAASTEGHLLKTPHIGWSGLILPKGQGNWANTPLREIQSGESAYFVHSFMARPSDPAHQIANCIYGGHPIVAAIGNGNVFGCQFHPEKSGTVGLKILKSFLTQ